MTDGRTTIERVPLARLHPAPWNPRKLRDTRFRDLCKSIQADPAMLERRPILAQADGTIYAGNQRFRAVEHLGWSDVPAIVEDVSDQLARERSIRDNLAAGEWVDQDLAELLAELQINGSELEALGFELFRLNQLIGDGIDDPSAEWRGMPEFEHEDKTAYKSLAVHFKDPAAVDRFADLVGQSITEQTRYLWYPEIEIERYADKRYAPDS